MTMHANVRRPRRQAAIDATAMSCPKDRWLGRRSRPRPPAGLGENLSPAERKAMRAIAEGADIYTINGKTIIVAEVDSVTVDVLSAFEAERAELEDNADAEPALSWSDPPPASGFGHPVVDADLEDEHDGAEAVDEDDYRPGDVLALDPGMPL